MSGLSEFELIETLLKPLAANAGGAFNLSDDAAVLPDAPPGEVFVVTKDALAVGTHMLASDPPGEMARKALRVNLSDLAAMGAKPVGFFMSLCLGSESNDAFLTQFVEGLAQDVEAFSIPLMGGDVIRHEGAFIVTITAIGSVARGGVLRRNGARPGDSLWVTGSIGDGALGLMAARHELTHLPPESQAALVQRYRTPEPRLAMGQSIVGLASACIDVSDGLVADVEHICKASSVGCRIESSLIPLSPAAEDVIGLDGGLWPNVLTGGDDYELAFAVPEERETQLQELIKKLHIPFSRIGCFEEGSDVIVVDQKGTPFDLPRHGYRHK